MSQLVLKSTESYIIDKYTIDVKCGFGMLHETGLALEKSRANHI